MVSVDGGVLAGNLQRYHLLFVSPDGIHQVEPIDAVVVFRLRVDVDFFEPRHRSVAGRLQDPHLGRTVLERADEILRVAVVRDAFSVGERDAVRIVFHHLQRGDELGRLVGGERD